METVNPHRGAAEIVALAQELSSAYEGSSDDTKFGILERLIGREYGHDPAGRSAAIMALELVSTSKSLNLAGARVLFRFMADSPVALYHDRLEWLARWMETQPAGTFDDPELRRIFQVLKRGDTFGRRVDGTEVARRIQLAIREPWATESCDACASGSAPTEQVDEAWIDVWVETWTQLAAELRAAGTQIDARTFATSSADRRGAAGDRCGSPPPQSRCGRRRSALSRHIPRVSHRSGQPSHFRSRVARGPASAMGRMAGLRPDAGLVRIGNSGNFTIVRHPGHDRANSCGLPDLRAQPHAGGKMAEDRGCPGVGPARRVHP